MKRKIIAAVCAVVVTLMPVTSASAGTLTLWENDNYSGNFIGFDHCNVDFKDNVYDSGKQDITTYVSIWNNTIWHGDARIGIIYKQTPFFDKENAADHATCLG